MVSFYAFIDKVIAQISAWAQEGAKTLSNAADTVNVKKRELEDKKKSACDWVAKVGTFWYLIELHSNAGQT
jgi:hypothetical protein